MAQLQLSSVHFRPGRKGMCHHPPSESPIDFYQNDGCVHTALSVSIQSDQFKNKQEETSTQTNEHFISYQEHETQKRKLRVQVEELHQVLGQKCRALLIARSELVDKTQEMETLEARLNEKMMANYCLEEENIDLKLKLDKLQVQFDYFEQMPIPHLVDKSTNTDPPTDQLSSTTDDELKTPILESCCALDAAQLSSTPDDDKAADVLCAPPITKCCTCESGLPELVCPKHKSFIHLIPVNGELVTMGSRNSFPSRGVANMDTVTEENECAV